MICELCHRVADVKIEHVREDGRCVAFCTQHAEEYIREAHLQETGAQEFVERYSE